MFGVKKNQMQIGITEMKDLENSAMFLGKYLCRQNRLPTNLAAAMIENQNENNCVNRRSVVTFMKTCIKFYTLNNLKTNQLY